ncbi:condensin subunit Smc [Alkalithermobacter thermoalcaliphilus JW-YL-7 = DSM 7308]|uniref:Chromosome partition protein Smc n=1 Tax=Alkalithermobacter thermoalcaliphilus JW-YL-7 = DSM 7308 TaxID=1121328 RepID=A0A150FR69_CLOPD|nr:chromosome segregation protein SMC [[Clostridium] paradoxum JW-YL-7 = DSM 7308]SHL00381.1 condensin subunit Smc [[Clostridium] paradoxum JW-YL-7 = DSM 7308]
MYLKKIEIKGFKSFPNKTEILFEKGITSIVGPNGSGKSNISDAIRWALGEQSIKSLRGDKLEDVIFAGSENKKAMSFCEVSLTIDNTEKILDIDYSEVTIKRVGYKSGESEFYINNKPCRLKDIKELLLDTGIGKEGYSIIEQGKIDEILSSNPSNRRKIFEEAAGISKYRYKKEEGEKNLKITKDNLDRITDIYYEIEKQIQPLEIQKEKAIKYINLKEELKVLEINSYLNEIQQVDVQLKELIDHKTILSDQLSDLESKKCNEEENISKTEQTLLDIDSKINEQNEIIYDTKSKIDNKASKISLLEEKIKNIESNKSRQKEELKVLNENIKRNIDNLEKMKLKDKDLTKTLERLNDQKTSIDNTIKEYIQDLKEKENKIEEFKDKIIYVLEEKNKNNAKLSSLKTTLENINERREDVKNEIKDINEKIKNSTAKLSECKTKENEYKAKLIQLNIQKDKYNKEYELVKDNLENIKESINETNLKINEYSSKLNIFYEMERQYEGFNKGVKEVLKNKNLSGILGAVAQVVKVETEYETAIEIALGSSLQNIITQDEQNAKQAIEYLKRNNLGRVTFLPLSIISSKKISDSELPNINGVLAIASDVVEYDSKFKGIIQYLLGRIIIAKDIDSAIQIARAMNFKYKVVTLDGQVLNAGGSLTGGSVKQSSNLLSRKRLINEFENKIKDLKEELTLKKDEKIKKENYLKQIDNMINEIDKDIKDTEKHILFIESEIYKLNEEFSNLKNTLLRLEKEQNGLKENYTYTNEMIKDVISKIEYAQIQSEDIQRKINDINNEKLQKENLYKRDINIYNELNLQIVKLTENIKSIKSEIKRLEDEKIEIEKSIKNKESDIKLSEDTKHNLSEELILIKVEKEELQEKLQDINSRLKNYKLQKESISVKLKNHKENVKGLDSQILDLKDSIYKLDSKINKLELSQDSYFNKLWNEYEMAYHEALKIKKDDIIADKRKIDTIKKEIKNLGNVNIDSIKEYEAVKQRYDLYKEQKNDLESSIHSIEALIKDMEQNMKIEFKKNFEKLNESFKVVFKKLFGGGYGELRLLDNNNILESDIEIIAKPPGKNLKNINLLSGGEKALTAIAILFSILLNKPTPFCILDEIEAPLDDANIYRYAQFLRELSTKTQFVTITHRRGTMEASDYIYGVSMQEKGISKLISLKIEQAQSFIDEEVI